MNPSAAIQAITFDAGGTLIQPWPSVGHVYAEVAARHGVKGLSPGVLNQNFARAWQSKVNFNHTREDWAEIVDLAFAGLAEQPPSQSFFPALYDRFAEPGAWRIYDDVLETLDSLAARDVRLAVISNWDERLRPLLKALQLDGYFEAIVVSCEVGFTKPSPVIFETAARKLGVPVQSILHVGDSEQEDVAGAQAAACSVRLVNRKQPAIPQRRLASLRELEELVC